MNNNLMEYKGYHAKIEFSAEDGTFFGRILGINDVIGFDGDTVSELESSFHDCVDDYLELCAEIGKEPDKEYKGTFNVRISPDLHKRAIIESESRNISLNQLVQQSIEHELRGNLSREIITIVMPPQAVECYFPYLGENDLCFHGFDGEEGLILCPQPTKFKVSAS